MAHSILGGGVYAGYDGVFAAKRVRAEQQYSLWFDKPGELASLYRASRRAAADLRRQVDGAEIVVLYSGGMDSEWVIESMIAANVKCRPLIVVYKDGLNAHDIGWAKRYLERRGIQDALWWELDLRAWYGSHEQREIAWNTQTIELAYTGHFKAMLANRARGRIFVTGYEEPLIVADDSGPQRQWRLSCHERHYSVIKFFDHYEVVGVPCWARFSAELFAAYTTNPLNQLLVANLVSPQIWNSELKKTQLYASAFPMMGRRPKFTGFEKALDFVVAGAKDWQKEIVERQGWKWDGSWSRDICEVWAEMGMAR